MKKLCKLTILVLILSGCKYTEEQQKIYDEAYIKCINGLYSDTMRPYCECNAKFFAENFDNFSEYKKWTVTGAWEFNNPIGIAVYEKCMPVFEEEMKKTDPNFSFEEYAKKALLQK
jgi:hypothetical protein